MKNILRLFTVFAAALFLAAYSAGCSTPWGKAKQNVENSRNLRVGMTKNEVLEVMGEPIRDEKFCEPDLWFYYIEMVWGDGLVTPEECLPLVFEDGKLIGWGNDFYLDHQIKRRKEDPGAALAKAEAAKARAQEQVWKNRQESRGLDRKETNRRIQQMVTNMRGMRKYKGKSIEELYRIAQSVIEDEQGNGE